MSIPLIGRLLDESKFSSLGKTKYGLLKQLAVVLILCSIIIPLIIVINLASFIVPWLSVLVIILGIGFFVYFAVKTFKTANKDLEKAQFYWAISEKASFFPGILWMSAFLFGCLCWFGSICFNFNIANSWIKFPLSAPEVVLVDNSGDIYCLSKFYNRLQVYDKNGNFLKGWFIDLPAGSFKILEDTDNNIRVVSANNSFISVFDKNGYFLRKSQRPDFDEKFYANEVKDSFGYFYKIRNPFFYPQIIKISNSGEISVVTGQSFGHWMVTMPVPGFVFLMVMIIIQGRLSRRLGLICRYVEGSNPG
jgi:hypothetical protein